MINQDKQEDVLYAVTNAVDTGKLLLKSFIVVLLLCFFIAPACWWL